MSDAPAAAAARLNDAAPLLSVVVTCYDAEAKLTETHCRLTAVCVAVTGNDQEIVYVDDGSRDSTWTMLSTLAGHDERG